MKNNSIKLVVVGALATFLCGGCTVNANPKNYIKEREDKNRSSSVYPYWLFDTKTGGMGRTFFNYGAPKSGFSQRSIIRGGFGGFGRGFSAGS